MKKILLTSLFFFAVVHSPLLAQASFNTIDSVNINKINAAVLVHGDMWWNPVTETAHCYFPNGSPINIAFGGGLWMSGNDDTAGLHVAVATYRQNGNDYWPGPLDATGALTYETSQKWAKIWKVNRTDINYFLSLSTHDSANTPQVILTWPGAGNSYARGNAGSELTFTPGYTYAPFVDVNGNGIYEPLLGDYPNVPGDQALWYVFSDNGPAHAASLSLPIGVEVQTLVYAYNRGTLIDNVIYYNYRIINRGSGTYNNFRVGQFADIDLGYYLDDYIGFDSSHRMGITYNGDSCDGCSAGSPLNSFGRNIPVVGVTMIKLPGDIAPAFVPAGSFDYYNNDNSDIGNPNNGIQYDGYLRSKLRTGDHFTNDFVGAGTPSKGYASGPNTNYVFPGDPADTTQWSECASTNIPGDRRFVIASNDFNLIPGSRVDVVMALVTTDPDTTNACGTGISFAGIKAVADTAWNNYFNPPAPLPPTIVPNVASGNVNIYPNPAHDQLFIENTNLQNNFATITMYNTLGQVMNVSAVTNNSKSTVDISHLAAGIYYLQYSAGSILKNVKIVKE